MKDMTKVSSLMLFEGDIPYIAVSVSKNVSGCHSIMKDQLEAYRDLADDCGEDRNEYKVYEVDITVERGKEVKL